jgi:hypothetical protein
MSLMQAILTRKSRIHKSLQPRKGCESTLNRSDKTHSGRTAILLCRHQMSRMQATLMA